jgi:hypothetical protein
VLGKLRKQQEPGLVMAPISKAVPQHLERFQQKPIKHDKSAQPGWGDAANCMSGRIINHETATLMVPAGVKLQSAKVVAAPV